MCSGPSAALATSFQIKGVNYSIASACSTSAHCIGNAAELIQWGKQDVMFAGGCEELDWTLSVLFDAMGAMSTKFNDTPAKASRAYDKNRDGFVIAGGAGVVVLEELEHAKARGAAHLRRGRRLRRHLGRLRHGCAVGRRRGALHAAGPQGPRRQGRRPRSTTSTRTAPARRSATCARSRRSARCSASDVPKIAATKSLTGHSLGAVGVQEAIFSLLMMNNGFICESANIDELDPDFADMPIVRERIDNVSLNCVMSNSFGFGGTNATLVFRRHDARRGTAQENAVCREQLPRRGTVGYGRRLARFLRVPAPTRNDRNSHDRDRSSQTWPDHGWQARAHHGRRQRALDRLGHRPRARRPGRASSPSPIRMTPSAAAPCRSPSRSARRSSPAATYSTSRASTTFSPTSRRPGATSTSWCTRSPTPTARALGPLRPTPRARTSPTPW